MSTFDPTKPVRWKNGRPFGRLLYADGGDSFFYEATDGVRSILSREFFERNAENIPEPPPKPRKWDAWDAADGSVRWSIWTSDAYSRPFQVVELTPAVRAALEEKGLLP